MYLPPEETLQSNDREVYEVAAMAANLLEQQKERFKKDFLEDIRDNALEAIDADTLSVVAETLLGYQRVIEEIVEAHELKWVDQP